MTNNNSSEKSSFENAMAEMEFRMPERRRLEVGEVIEGTIVSIGETDIFVDVGGKSEAAIEKQELEEEGQLNLKVGDKVSAYIVSLDPEVKLSRALARRHMNLQALEDAVDLGIPVEGKVVDSNKGGFEVEFAGAKGFCPISQIDRGFCEDPTIHIGQKYEFRVLEFKEGGRKIVVSRRALLDEEAALQAEEIKAQLFEGAEFDGKVASLQEYGAFVDIGGGIQGMVHISEITHSRIEHPNEVLKEGQSIRVKVMKVQKDPKNPKRERIALSMKALLGDPWDVAVDHLDEGAAVEGKVIRLQPFGAFVELSPGVDGLIHISELSDRRIKHPKDVVQLGERVRARVLKVDRQARRISLSLKDHQPDLVGDAGNSDVSVGTLVECVVDRIKPFGLFVKIKGTSLRGLIPNEETGAGQNANLRRNFPEGKELKAMVIEKDPSGKIKLSLTASADAEVSQDFAEYKAQSEKKNKDKSSKGSFGDLLQKALKK